MNATPITILSSATRRFRTTLTGWPLLALLALGLPLAVWMMRPSAETPVAAASSTPATPAATPAEPRPATPPAAQPGASASRDAPARESGRPEVQPAPAISDAVAAGSGPDEVSADVAATAATAYPDSERTLFLTIIGDKTYFQWGRAGDRPPRIDQLGRTAKLVEGDAGNVTTAAAAVNDYGPVENPLGPAPQECPRTLPPGSDQATADSLRQQASCRYLSSCAIDSQECTWYYQGRG